MIPSTIPRNRSKYARLAPGVLLALLPVACTDQGGRATAASTRGQEIFQQHCALCHGSMGRGDGRAARLYTPPPADLTRSLRDDHYKETIIRRGGAALGRSAVMPAWEATFSERDIADLLAYLQAIHTES